MKIPENLDKVSLQKTNMVADLSDGMNNLTIYSEKELKKIQQLELDCLKVIISICDASDIEYFLIGGTALGAVRHNGFIPWDDDIDVGMTRINYNKFLRVAVNALPKEYYLQTPSKDQNCPYSYSKVRINGTEFIEYCNRNIDMHQGVYVDIFPFDEVPDNEDDNLKQFNTVQRLIRIFSFRQSPDISSVPITLKDKVKSYIRRGIHIIYKLESYDRLIGRMNRECTKFNGTGQSYLACLNFPVRKKEYIKVENLYPLADHKFEDLIVKIPGNTHVYLKTHYGDYMKLPPETERFGHKPYKVFLGTDS